MPRNITPVTPSIVHKSDNDDVFVERPRLIIPEHIPTGYLNEVGVHALISAGLYSISPSRDLVAAANDEQAVPGFFDVKVVEEASVAPSNVLRSEAVRLPLTIVYNVKNSTDHYYFYRKEHEHVPGLMLIEIARQAMYHYVYNAYDIKRGQVSISMSSLLARFDDYTESAYPLSVVVSQNAIGYTPSPRHIDLLARFLQNGKWVGSVTLTGGVMKTALFERLRRFDPGQSRWFSPFAHWDMPILLEGPDGFIDDARLQAISSAGAMVQVKPSCLSSLQCVQRVVITTKALGCIAIPVADAQVDAERVQFNFAPSLPASSSALSEFIKRYCTLTEANTADAGIHQ